MARLANIEVEREHRPPTALLGPTDQPTQRRLAEVGAKQAAAGRDLERRRRQERLPRAVLVAGDDQIVVGLVADEGADRALVGEPSREIIADFTALRRDVGKSARGDERGGGKEP